MNPMRRMQKLLAHTLDVLRQELAKGFGVYFPKWTVIARDPTIDSMMVCVSNDELYEACRSALKHEAIDGWKGDEGPPLAELIANLEEAMFWLRWACVRRDHDEILKRLVLVGVAEQDLVRYRDRMLGQHPKAKAIEKPCPECTGKGPGKCPVCHSSPPIPVLLASDKSLPNGALVTPLVTSTLRAPAEKPSLETCRDCGSALLVPGAAIAAVRRQQLEPVHVCYECAKHYCR